MARLIIVVVGFVGLITVGMTKYITDRTSAIVDITGR